MIDTFLDVRRGKLHATGRLKRKIWVMSTSAPGENPLKDAKHCSFRADCEFMSRAHKSNYTAVEITTCDIIGFEASRFFGLQVQMNHDQIGKKGSKWVPRWS